MYNPRDDGTWYDAAGVKDKFGVAPDQVVDVLALMGDTIDNIKGVPGIGEKGARELIASYGSLDNLLEHAAQIPQKRYREPLLAHAESARQSRELARIRTNVPVEFDPDALRYRGASRERCFEIFNELGFRTLVAEYAPTADTTTRGRTASSTAIDELCARWPSGCASQVRSPCACCRIGDESAPMRASIVGLALLDRDARRGLRARSAIAALGEHAVAAARRRARRAAAGARSRRSRRSATT